MATNSAFLGTSTWDSRIPTSNVVLSGPGPEIKTAYPRPGKKTVNSLNFFSLGLDVDFGVFPCNKGL